MLDWALTAALNSLRADPWQRTIHFHPKSIGQNIIPFSSYVYNYIKRATNFSILQGTGSRWWVMTAPRLILPEGWSITAANVSSSWIRDGIDRLVNITRGWFIKIPVSNYHYVASSTTLFGLDDHFSNFVTCSTDATFWCTDSTFCLTYAPKVRNLKPMYTFLRLFSVGI